MQITVTGDAKELAAFIRTVVGSWEFSISNEEKHQLTLDEMPKHDCGASLYGVK